MLSNTCTNLTSALHHIFSILTNEFSIATIVIIVVLTPAGVHDRDSFIGDDGLLGTREVTLDRRLLGGCLGIILGDDLLLSLFVISVVKNVMAADIIDLVMLRHSHLFVNDQAIGPRLHHQLLNAVLRGLQILIRRLVFIWL